MRLAKIKYCEVLYLRYQFIYNVMYSDMDISNVPTEIAFILSYNIALLLPVLCSIFTEATILGQNGGDEAAVKVRSSQVFG